METQKGPYKDYSPFKKGTIWVSMLSLGECKPFGACHEYLGMGARGDALEVAQL